MEIRALREADDRTQFRSGNADLDRFFLRFAAQNQFRHYIGATYVAVDASHVLGYATVAPGHIEIEDLPAASRRQLPHYPLPVLRLARLAVDKSATGQGLGGQLLRFVLQLARRMAGEYGCIGVVVDAKPESVEFYGRYGFIPVDALAGRSDARPRPKPMFLGMRTIAAVSSDHRKG